MVLSERARQGNPGAIRYIYAIIALDPDAAAVILFGWSAVFCYRAVVATGIV